MARPLKAELKAAIRQRAAELQLQNPLDKTTHIVKLLADEFDLSPRTVWYHLRLVDKPDHRIKYTEAERARISNMSRRELEAYAAKHDLSVSTVYAVGWRYRSAKSAAEANLDAAQRVCEAMGYLNFAKFADLRAFGFSRSSYKDARKEIRKINGLDLGAPNYLLHPPTNRFYELSLSDQRFLLTQPRRFLAERAAHIKTNWKTFDPKHNYLIVVDIRSASATCEGRVISTHDTMEGALRAARESGAAKIPIPVKISRSTVWVDSRTPNLRMQPGEQLMRRLPAPMGKILPLPGLDTDFLER